MTTTFSRACGAIAAAAFCVPAFAVNVADNGSGTWVFPPAGQTYTIAAGYPLFHIVNGLPGGATIEIDVFLSGFNTIVNGPGGGLGGTAQTWNASAVLNMQGTGSLAGFNRVIGMGGMSGETHLAPHAPFAPVANFPSDLARLQGQVSGIGDPDFDLLRITAGTLFGMPSPGAVDATFVGPHWSLASFFDITYRIDFVGNPTGALAGLSGSTTHTTRISMVPTPGGAALLAAADLMATRRRRR